MSIAQAQWVINQTAGEIIGVAKGVLIASTSDNVQPLALMACEAFGSTLAMSAETCTKVYQLCSRSHESAVLGFIKAQVGYRKGDSAWQLAQSEAGVRFLGLAAALISLDFWTSAETLNELLLETAIDKKPVPFTTQIKDLLKALESKLCRSGFVENVLGWRMILRKHMKRNLAGTVPNKEALVALIKAISSLGRVGEAEKIDISTPIGHAPWILAFIRWCTNIAISVCVDNDEICSGKDSSILVQIRTYTKARPSIQVKAFDETSTLFNFITRKLHSKEQFQGTVGVDIFAKEVMRNLFGPEHEENTAFQTCIGILPSACEIVAKQLCFDNLSSSKNDSNTAATSTRIKKFPQGIKIHVALSAFLGSDKILQIQECPITFSETQNRSLGQQIKRWTFDLHCLKCGSTSTTDEIPFYTSCDFMARVSICVADILILSLI